MADRDGSQPCSQFPHVRLSIIALAHAPRVRVHTEIARDAPPGYLPDPQVKDRVGRPPRRSANGSEIDALPRRNSE